jgi:hypothetical protein
MHLRRLFAIVMMAVFLTGPAFAADWIVLRLRGDVQVLVEGNWVPLKRGDVVANEQMVRTLANGHAELKRDLEMVTLGSNTEIRIEHDSETGYTTVLQDFGRVEVDAEAKRVRHFEVRTPYLAAVVKGTHFVVTSDSGGTMVAVDRGSVSVQSVASERSTTIGVGQMATVKRKSDLVVSGLGPWPAIVEPGVARPAVVAALGGGLGSVPAADGDALELRAGFSLAPGGTSPALLPASGGGSSGGVRAVASSASALFGGFAVASAPSADQAEPAQPVSLGVVLIGALLGAALGGLALLLRRGL